MPASYPLPPARALRGGGVALLLGLAIVGLPGRASDDAAGAAAQAEHDRLAGEIEGLAQRQIWSGVERKFRELERLGTELHYDDLMHGATSARELGDVKRCYARLKAAARLQGSREIVDWLWDIDNNYGLVELLTVPSRSAELLVDDLPLDPNQRKAVEAAQESARQDGIFLGMLPKGDYEFATQRFTVEPGVSVRIEVSPRVRRQGLIDPVIVYRDEFGNPLPAGTLPAGALRSQGAATSPPISPADSPAEPPPTEE